MISIITVTLNNTDGLIETLDSLKQISKFEYEHIIIDGGSDDNFHSVIELYNNRIDQIISESDLGPYHAMNKGIDLVTRKYILFLNAGDTITVNFKEYLSLMKRHCTARYFSAPIQYSTNRFGGGSRKIIGYPRQMKKDSTQTEYFLRQPFPHPSFVCEYESFKRLGYFDTTYKIIADYVWLRNVMEQRQDVTHFAKPVIRFKLGGLSGKIKKIPEHWKYLERKNLSKTQKYLNIIYVALVVIYYHVRRS